jgi:hypothetical protein
MESAYHKVGAETTHEEISSFGKLSRSALIVYAGCASFIMGMATVYCFATHHTKAGFMLAAGLAGLIAFSIFLYKVFR